MKTPVVSIQDCRLLLAQSETQETVFYLDDLKIYPGEQVVITGPSGCGKSTLLNIISGLVRPEQGSVLVMNEDLSKATASMLDTFRGRRIGFIYQQFNLLEGFSVLENILIGMRFGRAVKRTEQRKHAETILNDVGLGNKQASLAERLSIGERQRVAVARAVCNQPALILADEPTGSLDPQTAHEVMNVVQHIAQEQKCTLITVTHDETISRRFERRIDASGWIKTTQKVIEVGV